eukprot:maker-scaffold_9-snap-gene-10.7-mRNA-1 protein AED:0.36 eAED:1.00 QI:0/0/0/1/1/1/2/0/362
MTSRKSKVCRSPAPSLEYEDFEPVPIKPTKKLTINNVTLARNVALLSSMPRDALRKKQHEENKKTKRLTFRKKKSAYEEINTVSRRSLNGGIDAVDEPVSAEVVSDSEESFVSIVENTEITVVESKASRRKSKMNENQKTLKKVMHNNLRLLAQKNVDDYSDLVEHKRKWNQKKSPEDNFDIDFDDESRFYDPESAILKKKSGSLKEFNSGEAVVMIDERRKSGDELILKAKKSRDKIKERKSRRRGQRERVTVEKFKEVIEAKYNIETGIPTPRKRRSGSEDKCIQKDVDSYEDVRKTKLDSNKNVDPEECLMDEKVEKGQPFTVNIRGKQLTLDRKSVQNERLALLLSDDLWGYWEALDF